MYDEYGCAEDERRARDYEHVITNSEITDKELLEVMINSKWNNLAILANNHAELGEIYDVVDEIAAMQEMIENNKADGEWKEYCNDARYNYESRGGFDWAGFEKEWQQ